MGSFYSVPNVETKHKYGWKPDIPDVRDKKLKFYENHYTQLKSKVDLRYMFDYVYDQGNLGSCTANAICSAFTFDQKNQELPLFDPSRMFLYYNERKMEGTTNYDSGASIRDGIKSINKIGICEEKLWPYHVDYFTSKPGSTCYKEAKFHRGIRYKRLDNTNLNDLKACLSLGQPFIFGFAVYDSFEDPTCWNPKIDEMPIPNPNKEKLLGGHAVLAVGYSNKRKCFIVRNSWGSSWGMSGYFFMPYRYITSEACSDFWVLETISDDEVILDNQEFKLKLEKSYVEISKNNKRNKKKKHKKHKKIDKVDSDESDIETVVKVKISADKEKLPTKCLIKNDD